MFVLHLDEFTTRQRATWECGDYSACTPYIAEVGGLVVMRAGITPGMRALDVACGTGNAAIPAARAGARLTGLDLAAKLLEAGRARARAEGLEIEWREGGAESRSARKNIPREVGGTGSNGFVAQGGYLVAPRMLEIAGRFGTGKRADAPPSENRRELGLAVGYFVNGHNLKVQTDVRRLIGTTSDEPASHEVRVQLQVVF